MEAAFLAIAAGFNFGSTLTALPVEVIDHMGEQLGFEADNPTIVAVMETALPLGGALGMCLVSLVSGKLGLVRSIAVLFAAHVVATGLCAIPVMWWYTAIVRFFCGFFTSELASLAPLLVAQELEPAQRARTMVFYSVALNVSILMSYFVHFLVSFNYKLWCFMFLPTFIVCSASFAIAVRFMRVSRTKHRKANEAELMTVDGVYGEDQSQPAPGIESSTFVRTDTEETTATFARKHVHDAVNTQKLTRSQFARMIFVTIALAIMQIWTGEDVILVYTTELFSGIFDSPKSGIYGSLIFGSFQLVASLIIAPIAERQKRRKMLMIGVIGCAATNLLIALTYMLELNDYVLIVLIMLFTVFFLIGPEPIVFMLFSEMYPEKYKVRLNGLAYAVNWTATIVQIFVFEYFVGGLEQYIFLIFAILTATLGISGTLLAPETHEKTLLEIELQIRSWGRKKNDEVEVAPTQEQTVQISDFTARRVLDDDELHGDE